jgi:hypothetical protein
MWGIAAAVAGVGVILYAGRKDIRQMQRMRRM